MGTVPACWLTLTLSDRPNGTPADFFGLIAVPAAEFLQAKDELRDARSRLVRTAAARQTFQHGRLNLPFVHGSPERGERKRCAGTSGI